MFQLIQQKYSVLKKEWPYLLYIKKLVIKISIFNAGHCSAAGSSPTIPKAPCYLLIMAFMYTSKFYVQN